MSGIGCPEGRLQDQLQEIFQRTRLASRMLVLCQRLGPITRTLCQVAPGKIYLCQNPRLPSLTRLTNSVQRRLRHGIRRKKHLSQMAAGARVSHLSRGFRLLHKQSARDTLIRIPVGAAGKFGHSRAEAMHDSLDGYEEWSVLGKLPARLLLTGFHEEPD